MAKPAKISQYLKGRPFVVTLKITICKNKSYTCRKPVNDDVLNIKYSLFG